MYPKLIVNLEKLRENIDAAAKITKEDGNCFGTITKDFTIAKKPIDPTITVSGSYTYTGSAITPDFTVLDDSRELADTDYTCTLSSNMNAGKGTIRISAVENSNYAPTLKVYYDN